MGLAVLMGEGVMCGNGPDTAIYVSPGHTHPCRGLLDSVDYWQETAEQPVPEQHPGCPDSLLSLHVDQEGGKALDKKGWRAEGQVPTSLTLPHRWEKQLLGASQAPA